jgi:hypothetical protein
MHDTYHCKQHETWLLITENEVSMAVYLEVCNIQKRLEENKLLFVLRWKCFNDFVRNVDTLSRS